MARFLTGVSGTHRLLLYSMLTLTLLFAAATRILWTQEGLPYLHFWDEPYTSGVALRMLKTGDLNPHFFRRGTLMIYLNLMVDIAHYFYLKSQPEFAVSFLGKLDDIRIAEDTGWFWTISHPSFYLWNRWLTAAFGTASVAITFLLSREISGPWAGVLAAIFLASLDFHIQNSAIVYLDVPVSFFMLCTVYLSVLAIRRGQPSYLFSSFVVSGLAASAKYNGLICWVIPFVALLSARLAGLANFRKMLWLGLFLVPPLTFLLTSPYVLLNSHSFWNDVLSQIRRYQQGHTWIPEETVGQGAPHLLLQLTRIWDHAGAVVSILGIAGLLLLPSKKQGWLVVTFVCVYMAFMSQWTSGFHRNYIPIYPFVGLSFGTAVVFFHHHLLQSVSKRNRIWLGLPVALILTVAVFIGLRCDSSLRQGWYRWHSVESRSQVIDKINALAPERNWKKIGIAEELRIHEQDLRRLNVSYEIHPFSYFLCGSTEKVDALISAVNYEGPPFPFRPVNSQERARFLNSLIPQNPLAKIQGGFIDLDYHSTNPGVLILPNVSKELPLPLVKSRIFFDDPDVRFLHFYNPENGFRWTQGESAITHFLFDTHGKEMQIVLETFASHPAYSMDDLALRITVNDRLPAVFLRRQGGQFVFRVDGKLIQEIRCLTIQSRTFVPREVIGSRDSRRLGIQLINVRLEEAIKDKI